MRVDVATILIGMGFSTPEDFSTAQSSPLSVDLIWRSVQPQPSAADIDAFALANPNAYINRLRDLRRTAAAALTTDLSSSGVQLRAAVSIMVDEINALRARQRAQDAAVAAATSLNDLKSRWATVASAQPLPDRTLAQAKTAYQNAIAAGTAD